jgi:periplasmic protein TonB
MAYTDPKPLSQSRVTSIVIVILLHAVALYAMLTGGAQYAKKVLKDLDVIEIEKEPPPPPEKLPPPPPPDTKLPPPPVVPPPIVQTNAPPPPTVIVSTPTPPPVVVTMPAPPAPPPPPQAAVKMTPRGSPQSWVTNDDYPPSAQRDGVEGTTGFALQVGPDGRVTSCTVTSSSGSSLLDDTACRLLTRRARFNPAKDANGQAMGDTFRSRFRWQIQQ